MQTEASQARRNLITLPFELQLKILRYILVDNESPIKVSCDLWDFDRIRPVFQPTELSGQVLRTHSTLYRLGEPMLYGKNSFWLKGHVSLARFADTLGARKVEQVRTLHLRMRHMVDAACLERFTNLEQLVFDEFHFERPKREPAATRDEVFRGMIHYLTTSVEIHREFLDRIRVFRTVFSPNANSVIKIQVRAHVEEFTLLNASSCRAGLEKTTHVFTLEEFLPALDQVTEHFALVPAAGWPKGNLWPVWWGYDVDM